MDVSVSEVSASKYSPRTPLSRTPRINWTAELIRKFLVEHRFSYANFGRALGATGVVGVRKYSRQTVRKWAEGIYTPNVDAMRALDVLAYQDGFKGE